MLPPDLLALSFGCAMGFVGSIPLTGPIALLVFHRGLQGQYLRGIAVGLGGTTGELIYCALAVAGVGALVKQFPLASAGLKTVSALILIAFGLYFLIDPPDTQLEHADETSDPSESWPRDFLKGFTISAFNPILLLNWTAAVAIVYSMMSIELDMSGKASFVLGAGLGVGGWFSLLIAILRYFHRQLPERLIDGIQRAMGAVVLVAAALPIHDVLSGLS